MVNWSLLTSGEKSTKVVGFQGLVEPDSPNGILERHWGILGQLKMVGANLEGINKTFAKVFIPIPFETYACQNGFIFKFRGANKNMKLPSSHRKSGTWWKNRRSNSIPVASMYGIFGCFLKLWYPPNTPNTPKWSFLVGKPMVVGYHHFRKPPFTWYHKHQPNPQGVQVETSKSPVQVWCIAWQLLMTPATVNGRNPATWDG